MSARSSSLASGEAEVRGVALDEALVLADPVDVRVDADLVEQALVVELRAAGAGGEHRTDRIHPHLAGVSREQIARIVVRGGEGEHRLAVRAHAVERGAELADRRLAAAGEAIEIEHDRFHPRVLRAGVHRTDDVAQRELVGPRAAAARQQIADAGVLRLLDEAAVEIEQQRAAAGRDFRLAAAGQAHEDQPEDDQQEEQRERVLHAHQKCPQSLQEALHSPSPYRRITGLEEARQAGNRSVVRQARARLVRHERPIEAS